MPITAPDTNNASTLASETNMPRTLVPSSTANTLLQQLLESLKNNSGDAQEVWEYYRNQGCSFVKQNHNMESILDVAITHDHHEIATELLNSPAASQLVKLTDAIGQTAVFKALAKNNPLLLSLLLEKGADANHKNNNGLAPLHFAAQLDWKKDPIILFGVLLHYGALPYLLTGNDKSNQNVTPLQLAYTNMNNRTIEAMLNLGFGMGATIRQTIPSKSRLPLPLIGASLENKDQAQNTRLVTNWEQMQAKMDELHQTNAPMLSYLMPHWRWCCYHAWLIKPDNSELKDAWQKIFYPKINNLFNESDTWFSSLPRDILRYLSLFYPGLEGNSERAQVYIDFGSSAQPEAPPVGLAATESPLSLAALAARGDSPELTLTGAEKGALARTNIASLSQQHHQQLLQELNLLAQYFIEANELVPILASLQQELNTYGSSGWRQNLAGMFGLISLLSISILLILGAVVAPVYWAIVNHTNINGDLGIALGLLCNIILTMVSGYLAHLFSYSDYTPINKLPRHLVDIFSELEKIDPSFIVDRPTWIVDRIVDSQTVGGATVYISKMIRILTEQSGSFLEDINQHQISNRNHPDRIRAIDFVTNARADDLRFFNSRRRAADAVAIDMNDPATETSPLLAARIARKTG